MIAVVDGGVLFFVVFINSAVSVDDVDGACVKVDDVASLWSVDARRLMRENVAASACDFVHCVVTAIGVPNIYGRARRRPLRKWASWARGSRSSWVARRIGLDWNGSGIDGWV